MEVNVRQARERFSELLNAVESGEEVTILRRGKAVACLKQAVSPDSASFRSHRALRSSLPAMQSSAETTVRAMRDEDDNRF